MWKLSQEALINNRSIKDNNIIIGYFSGSITHNLDLELIKPALIKILKKFKNVKLLLVGKISYPKYLKEFYKEILVKSFIDWTKLIIKF
jgi:glycosyltransferase involved in cell wall biosynthesis